MLSSKCSKKVAKVLFMPSIPSAGFHMNSCV